MFSGEIPPSFEFSYDCSLGAKKENEENNMSQKVSDSVLHSREQKKKKKV